MRERKAFTLVEVMVVAGLTAFLAAMLASAWANLGSPAADLKRRAACIQEMTLAVAALARDLGGYQPDYQDTDSHLGNTQQGYFTAWNTDGDDLQLTYRDADGATYQVDYYLDTTDHLLIRKNVDTGKLFTVADHVENMEVTDYTSYIEITLTFNWSLHPIDGHSRSLTRKCTLKVKKPTT